MDYGRGISEAFGCLLTIAVIGVLGTIGFGAYTFFSAEKIESDRLLIPEIKLEIKDNKVDTIYIYKVE